MRQPMVPKSTPRALAGEEAVGNLVNLGMMAIAFGAWGWYKLLEPASADLSDADRFLYVLKRCTPTLMMQWGLFETIATYRAAMTSRGECPFPFEDQTRSGPGKPVPAGLEAFNPPRHAFFIRAATNRFESTLINLFATLVMSQFCYGPKMYDVRLPAVFGYIHAVGSLVYAFGYTFGGPNYRMLGFIGSGFWNNMAILLFCFLRQLGLGEDHPGSLCLWCLFGWPVFNILILIVVKVKYLTKEATARPFGYDRESLS